MPSRIPGMAKYATVTLKRGVMEADEFDFTTEGAAPEAGADASAAAVPFAGEFADVFAFTPPETPATPPGVPVPYPSFGQVEEIADATAADFVTLA